MPKARYQKNEKNLYYVYVPTNELRADGYTKYKKLQASTMAALDEKKQQYERDHFMGLDAKKLTVDAWFDKYYVSYKSASTVNTQNFYLNLYRKHISPAIGDRQVKDVTEAAAQRILTGMAAAGYAQKTVKSVRSLLFSLFDKAVYNKLISSNPCAKLTAAGRKTEKRRALTPEERSSYLSQIPHHPFGLYAALLYYFGLRRGEALAVRGSDFSGGVLHVRRQIVYPTNHDPLLQDFPKTEAGVRDLPIPNGFTLLFDPSAFPSGLLFAQPDGEPLSYTTFRSRWESFLSAALGPETDVTVHYLRHNYCTLLFENGVDLLTVQRLAGHESIKTTLEIYTHYTDSLRDLASEKVLSI